MRPDEVLDAFGVPLDPGRFAEPQLAPAPESAARIAAALGAAAEAAGLKVAQAGRRPGLRRKSLIAAISDLYRAGERRDCAHLAVAADLDHPRSAILAARAFEGLRAHGALTAYLAAQEARPDLVANNRRTFLDIRMHNWLGIDAADHRMFVPGPVPASLAGALARLPAPGPDWVVPQMVRALVRLRGLDAPGREAEAAEFAARVAWGRAAQDYLTFLGYWIAPQAVIRPGGPGTGADAAGIRALALQVRDLVVPPDPNPMIAAARAGRSVILTSAHAGLPIMAPHVMVPTGLPRIGISAVARTDLDNPEDKRIGAYGNFHADILKAVKILRRQPHLVQLLPDGGLGGAPVIRRFRGRPLPLGPGAEMMAWQGRAAVFFFSTRWRDGRLHVYVETGPVAEPGGDRAAFTEAFYGFYLGCLEAIVSGPPEDMAPGGGFWTYVTADHPIPGLET